MTCRPLLCAILLALGFPLAAGAQAASETPVSAASGIDPRDLDTTVAPCDDFYRFANGGWLRSHPLPSGIGTLGLFDQLRERHHQQRLRLVEHLGRDPGRAGEPLADFLASGLDEVGMLAYGRQDLTRLLGELEGFDQPAKQLPPLLARLHAQGLPLLFSADVAHLQGGPQLRLLAGGLGLPDRDFYLREDIESRQVLGLYRGYVESILALAGSPDPVGEAAWVLDAEMRLARGRAPHGQAPPASAAISIRDLQRRFPTINWRDWLTAQGLARQSTIVIPDPAFFTELEALMTTAHQVQWLAYLRFHLAHLMAPFLDAEFVAAHDLMFQRVLRGRIAPLTRTERVREASERVLGPAFERELVAWLLPDAARASLEQMIAAIRTELHRGLETAPWLDAASRAPAQTRLDQLTIEIAVAADGDLLEGASFDRNRFSSNVLIAARRLHQARLAPLSARRTSGVQRAQGTPPMAVQYDPRSNTLQLGIGVLQAPLFATDGDAALQYGSLGSLIGHELLHGFDLAGAAWSGQTPSPERIQAFEAHTLPLKAQFDGFTVPSGHRVDGSRTLAENAADLAGVELAWAALEPRLGELNAASSAYTPAQRFHIGWAQMWRRNYHDDELRRRLASELQAPSQFRVNGPLSQLDAFSGAFDCAAGTAMTRSETERVRMFP